MPFPTQLSSMKAAEDGPRTWDSVTHVGNQDRTLHSWLQPVPDQAIAGICE